MEWLANGKITNCVQVDNLHLMLDDPKLRKVFEKQDYKEAEKLYLAADTDDVLSIALEEVCSVKAASLKTHYGDEVRVSLRELKAAITQLEAEIGEPM